MHTIRAFIFMSANVPGLPNPQSWARHLRFCSSANAVTGQGLGEVSAANEAGNPVLYVVGASIGPCHDGKARFSPPQPNRYGKKAEPPKASEST